MVTSEQQRKLVAIIDEVLHAGGTVGLAETLDNISNIKGYSIIKDSKYLRDHSDIKYKRQEHPTEQAYPEQCAMFKEILDKMYQLHLEKNHDYSPMNMLATGMDGAVVRIWDKVARIMNLCGFDIRTGLRLKRKEPKNESLEDSFFDNANYSVIALILKAGKWGK